MKKILNKLIKGERGQALPIVLILLLIGGLIIAPLLGYMSTGLMAGQLHEELMERLYAADAGVEDALYKIMTDNPLIPQILGDNQTYNIGFVNDKGVDVSVVMADDAEGFVDFLLEENYSGTHEGWSVVDSVAGNGTYTITVSYNGSAMNKKIDGVGAWLVGDWVCTDNSSGANDMTDDYPNYTFEVVEDYGGGTAFIWGWTGGNRPVFQPGDTMTQSFDFTPEVTPSFNLSWVVGGSADIGVVTSDEIFGIWKVIATATDNVTGEQTAVTAYISMYSDNTSVSILSWGISP